MIFATAGAGRYAVSRDGPDFSRTWVGCTCPISRKKNRGASECPKKRACFRGSPPSGLKSRGLSQIPTPSLTWRKAFMVQGNPQFTRISARRFIPMVPIDPKGDVAKQREVLWPSGIDSKRFTRRSIFEAEPVSVRPIGIDLIHTPPSRGKRRLGRPKAEAPGLDVIYDPLPMLVRSVSLQAAKDFHRRGEDDRDREVENFGGDLVFGRLAVDGELAGNLMLLLQSLAKSEPFSANDQIPPSAILTAPSGFVADARLGAVVGVDPIVPSGAPDFRNKIVGIDFAGFSWRVPGAWPQRVFLFG